MKPCIYMAIVLLLCACSSKSESEPQTDSDAKGIDETHAAEVPVETFVMVTAIKTTVYLDGEPAEGVTVSQGGLPERWTTGQDGIVVVEIDRGIEGDIAIVASHPEARIEGEFVWEDTTEVTIHLDRFNPEDNPEYEFQNPGDPGHSPTSAQCGHCHVTIAEDFFNSRHPYSASNPAVQDLYSGTGLALGEEADCLSAGGSWKKGPDPAGGEESERCYLATGVLSLLNEEACPTDGPCVEQPVEFGGCADCHAPGIDGQLGGRNLLDAEGYAYTRGVHCDVCHHVESIQDDKPAGVAGRLGILRPSDPADTPSFGDWRPLLFGPHDDIPNPFMGIAQRLVFLEARFCSGCHQLDQKVLVPGETIDSERWPGEKLPVHSTFAEWKETGMGTTCQACHMPHDPDVANTADLQLFPSTVGVAGGWPRPVPSVRRHIWYGPKSEDSPLRETAASLVLDSQIEEGVLTVTAKTTKTGAGHALPSGEPMRSLVLLVDATCDGSPLVSAGGDIVPDFGGYLAMKDNNESWALWPGAKAGNIIRVVARQQQFRDYDGIGPFGDGTFSAEQKGMPVEHLVGEATVLSVDGDSVTLDAELPEGDVAYLLEDAPLPETGSAIVGRAGAPGFAFARVLVDADGQRMAPHFRAVDVASDNRLLLGQTWTTQHKFEATCEEPTVRAVLSYRLYPPGIAAKRGWQQVESLLAQVTQ